MFSTFFNIADPRCWSREDVQTWIRHLAAVHNLPAVQPDRFLMNGKALCLMTMEMAMRAFLATGRGQLPWHETRSAHTCTSKKTDN